MSWLNCVDGLSDAVAILFPFEIIIIISSDPQYPKGEKIRR